MDRPYGLDSVRLSIDYSSDNKVVLTLVEIISKGTVESVELSADGEITWLDQAVSLAAVAEDPSESEVIYDWSYVAPEGTNVILDVDVDDNSLATLKVVNPDPSGQVVNVQVQAVVSVQGGTNDPFISNTVNIEVHDTACLAARNGLGLKPKADLKVDCMIDLADFALLAADWLADYEDLAGLAADWLDDYELKAPASK